jgi:predicted permease
MVLRWSYGVRLLAQSDPESEAGANADTVDETSALLGEPVEFPADEGTLRPNSSAYDDPVPHISVQAPPPPPLLRPGHERRRSRFYNSFPNSPNQSRVQLPTVDSIPNSASQSTFAASPVQSEDSEDELLPGPAEPAPSALPQHVRPSTRHARQASTISQVGAGPAGHLRRTRRRLYRAWVALNEFMTVPLWAALASLVVACVQPLQHALDDHMQPIKGAVTSAGNCSIPLTLIVLGGYFYPAPPEGAAANGHANGNGVGNGHGNGAKHARRVSQSTHSLLESVREMFGKQKNSAPAGPFPGETKTVVIAVLSRMILTPLLLLPLMVVCARFDLHAVFDECVLFLSTALRVTDMVWNSPVFVVANVLLVSSPPALTLAQVSRGSTSLLRNVSLRFASHTDNASSVRRRLRATHQPHDLLGVLRRHTAHDDRVCYHWLEALQALRESTFLRFLPVSPLALRYHALLQILHAFIHDCLLITCAYRTYHTIRFPAPHCKNASICHFSFVCFFLYMIDETYIHSHFKYTLY